MADHDKDVTDMDKPTTWPRAHCPGCGRLVATLYRDPIEHTVGGLAATDTEGRPRARGGKPFVRLRAHHARPGQPCPQHFAFLLQAVS